jgi:hypothetical protein
MGCAAFFWRQGMGNLGVMHLFGWASLSINLRAACGYAGQSHCYHFRVCTYTVSPCTRRDLCNYYKRPPSPILSYSQTFENKSSLPPPKPPEGLFVLAVVFVVVDVVVVGAALLQPPKSSSWPDVPHPGLFGWACEVVAVGAAGWLGTLDDQTSLLPQPSMLP